MLTQREQRALYESLVDKAGKEIANAFLEAIQRTTARVTIKQLADAIDRGDLREIEALLRFEQGALFPLQEAMRSAFVQGGLSAAKIVSGAFDFNGRNPRAEAFIARQAFDFDASFTSDQRDMLRAVMQVRIQTGESGATTAQRITGTLNKATGRREGGFIGLSSQQTNWALNAERELETLDSNYFTRRQRDRRYDPMVRRAIKTGKPLSKADIKKVSDRYRDRLLKQRGEVIARTEAHKATSAGQWEGFQQLVSQGVNITKRWVHGFSREPRDDHKSLGLAPSRPLDTPFVTADGIQMKFPHDPDAPASEVIGCKCSAYYRIVD